MKPNQQTLEFNAPRDDNARLANLCGPLDENLRQIEQALDVTLSRRGHRISIRGRGAKTALTALENFYNKARDPLSVDDIQLALVEARHLASRASDPRPSGNGNGGDTLDPRFRGDPDHPFDEPVIEGLDPEEQGPKLYTRRADLRGRTPAQREYLKQIISHDVTFGIGPAGTGKTYLAVACAVDALERDQVKRIVLTRPAVEAGERLGFLPGDLAQKVDPYLRPLYDALYDLLGFDKTAKMFERQMIEIAPLAYMRGRTLNHAFIILDEAQNTTPEQMKMFLTRIGFGSKAVVTGDTTQVDLPRGHKSGLIEAQQVLTDVRGIALTRFTSADVVRHPLVARIVEAYDAHAKKDGGADAR
ncbi:PhoH family protein [Paraburkholderia caballeronis]|uniref:PhoH-like protein n=1 Tax=Paraburkholderia caballeronis TaxID=416943 RepID=A0A1H7PW36_9BURK|nr:PhoH family protein [Paraburkholderia caballeronis]PXW24361.1 phosphate starvation-inducible protein PhoH [Paraburkholderia caballeronis]PXX00143.1 phosphate starvation-inducible protein PhoH [Paraburkholderia caballeronis]RAJ97272.1 phosphate starvation-inducible protein PhoH [Paraburkholderia caballeronis]TDV09895.1 phosphate starvation-inducible protein PhoH [Paraburkholderia caballeronis]TDV14140.1 phosphate starvation-inducible protein PhoH [Paraburkholderia caballeronis]